MKNVVIIGAGYGGLRAVEHLAVDPNLHIVLIDKNPYHYLQTEAYGYIAGRFDLHDVAIDLKNWCHGFKKQVEFVHDEALKIDADAQTVQTRTAMISYDYLIIATGALTNFYAFIKGLREHSFGVKQLHKAFVFRTEFERLLYEKIESNGSGKHGVLNLAIGGAGLSGVEIAAEMAYVIRRHAKSIGEAASELKIHLIDASSTILPGMSEYIIGHTKARLEALHINIMTDSFIDRVTDSQIHFKDGRTLDYHFMIFTGGIKVPGLEFSETVTTNRLNQFNADETLRLAKFQNVFAVGDCVEIRDREGRVLPPTAQIAERSAEYAALAIKRLIQGRSPEPFNAKVDGVFVALGGNYAVGELFGVIKVKGYAAYLLKKFVTHTYYLGLKLRVNTGFNKRTENI